MKPPVSKIIQQKVKPPNPWILKCGPGPFWGLQGAPERGVVNLMVKLYIIKA